MTSSNGSINLSTDQSLNLRLTNQSSNQSRILPVDHASAPIHDESTDHTNKRASSTNHSRSDDKRRRYQSINQANNQSIDQPINQTTSQSMNPQPVVISPSLLTYPFLLPLVISYLNDGDVLSRLLIVNTSIRRMSPKYSFKLKCEIYEALQIVNRSRDIRFAITRVRSSPNLNELLRLEQINHSPLLEVHYSVCFELAYIPRFVTHLMLPSSGHSHNPVKILAGVIPNSVVDLLVGTAFELQRDSIPPSVKSVLVFTDLPFNTAVIPDTVTDLKLTPSCVPFTRTGTRLCGPLPNSLKHLDMFRHVLPLSPGVIPQSVITIESGNKLLSELEPGVIPNSVTHVKLIWHFDCVIKPGVLPDSVTSLEIITHVPMKFTPRWLPVNLTHLTLHVFYEQSTIRSIIPTGILPGTLTHFQSNCEIKRGILPDGVTHVYLKNAKVCLRKGALPHSVTHLKLHLIKPNLTPGLIPSSVTHLDIHFDSNQKLIPGIIPDSVTHLKFDCFSSVPSGFIPQPVTHLTLDFFNSALSRDMLPRNLTHLNFGYFFNQSISDGIIPRTVTSLVLGHTFNQPILPSDIPSSVTHLSVSSSFSHELDSSNLPSSLTYLEIPRGYLKSNDKLWLPSSVTHLAYKLNCLIRETAWSNWCIPEGLTTCQWTIPESENDQDM